LAGPLICGSFNRRLFINKGDHMREDAGKRTRRKK
jgi:hypothetical protein